MSSPAAPAHGGDRFDVQPSVSNHFAWLRTQLGLQRTLMAAVRTSVSLIGFGFTVAQFFERLISSAPAGGRHWGPEASRNFGLVLIGAGVISLAIFTWQYRTAMIYLRGAPFLAIAPAGPARLYRTVYVTAFAVILIGIAAFISVFARF